MPVTNNSPVQFTLPADLPAGRYLVCFGPDNDERSCVAITVR